MLIIILVDKLWNVVIIIMDVSEAFRDPARRIAVTKVIILVANL
jgi:hypothetical protein